MRNLNAMLLGGAALAAISGLALGCPPGDEATGESDVWVGSFDEQLGEGRVYLGAMPMRSFSWQPSASEPGAVHRFAWTLRSDGQDEAEHEEIIIIEENGRRKVIRNGKELSEAEAAEVHERMKHLHGQHQTHDLHGTHDTEEIELHLTPSADGTVTLAPRIRAGDGQARTWTVSAAQPKVMVGITMAEPDEALRHHLGIGDRQVIMLDGVLDGLPAAQAGLKRYDVIVAIDDNDDEVTQERLHKVLSEKSPGDELRLRVLRGGQKETYRVKLQAYDAGKLGIEAKAEPSIAVEHEQAGSAEHLARLKEMSARLRELGLNAEQIAQIQRQFNDELRSALEKSREAIGPTPPRPPAAPNRSQFVFTGPDGRMLELKVPDMGNLEVPEALRDRIARFGGDESGDMEQRLARLERRMDEMSEQFEERMERALSRFEEMTERLDKRLRDGG